MTANGHKPYKQALQAVDVAVGAGPTVAEAVRNTAKPGPTRTHSQEIEALQKHVQTLHDRKARTTKIESLQKHPGGELERPRTRAATSAVR